MKSDTWERHEADVILAYMAAPISGICSNDIGLIVDMESKAPFTGQRHPN